MPWTHAISAVVGYSTFVLFVGLRARKARAILRLLGRLTRRVKARPRAKTQAHTTITYKGSTHKVKWSR